MPGNADTVYGRHPWTQPKPWQSNEERLVTESLAANAELTIEQIHQIRPPLPRVELFPPRFGYRRDALGIRDLVNVDTIYPGARYDYSGMKSGYSGTSTPSLGVF